MRSLLPRLFGSKPPRNSALTREGLLASELWIDQPDAHQRIERKLREGAVDAEQAARLRQFVDDGYMVLSVPLDAALVADLEGHVERLWREKPFDAAYAYRSSLRLFAYAEAAKERQPSYRIADLHSVSAGALALYLQKTIFQHVELMWEQKAVATQSLYFEYGSQQALHRDPVHVHTSPPNHLVAAWIALEDIGPKCGPLIYVPGSHRLPYWQDANGEYRLPQGRHTDQEVLAAAEFDLKQCERRGLSPRPFTCKRGEVLIWHHSLLHGGAYPEDPLLTRKSFVVHFSTRANYKRLRQNVIEYVEGPGGERVERTHTFGTSRVLERDGCEGFDNPLRGYQGPAGPV